jgi:hypothetical protein
MKLRWSVRIAGGFFITGICAMWLCSCDPHTAGDKAEKRPEPRIVDHVDKIVDGNVSVAAGKANTYSIEVKDDMIDPTLTGSFTASGGSGNDVKAAIADSVNMANWLNDHASEVLWQTAGQLTAGNFEVRLTTGTYILAISNRFSTVSDKTVALQVNLSYKRKETDSR